MSEYEIRPYRPGDELAVLETFNRVFAEGDPGYVPRTLEEWRWQYLENPAGIRLHVAMHGDVVAAAYASQPNRVLVDGERETIFCQIIDSMVHPEHRRGLKRPGLFVETAWRMLDDHVDDPIVFGLPNPQAWRMGRTFLRYELVRWQGLFVRELGGAGAVERPEAVETLDRFGPEARRLFDRCTGGWGASVIRDEHYLNWRFVANPRHDYELLAVRDGGELAGYAVWRRGDWPLPGIGLLCDLLVAPGDEEAALALEEAVLARARESGVPLVVQILPEWSPWALFFQERGWRLHPSDYLMSGRMTEPRFDMYWLRDRWWYTLAEVDLV